MRNLTKALAAVSLLVPTSGYSLGVGGIKLHSALNQKLRAEIALVVSAKAGENVDDIKVSLAPPDKFDEAGVKWSYFLSKIKFTPIKKSNGAVVIQLTSSEPLKEPFLDFLVEVNWSKGSLYREFTVLLDPPSTYAQPIAPIYKAPVYKAPVKKDVVAVAPSSKKITTKPFNKPLASSDPFSEEVVTTRPYYSATAPTTTKLDAFITEKPSRQGKVVGEYKPTLATTKPFEIPKKTVATKAVATNKTQNRIASLVDKDGAIKVPKKTVAIKPVVTHKIKLSKKSLSPFVDKDGVIKAPTVAATSKTAKEYGPTRKNSTLYRVAKEVNAHPGVSVQQMMIAIYKANPDAFYAQNVNALNAGQILHVPNKEAILKTSHNEATAEFGRQNRQWKGGVSPRTKKKAFKRKRSLKTNLKLIAPSTSKVSKNTKATTSAKNKKAEKEAIAKLVNPSKDLDLRLKKLQEQLKKVQAILVFKDQQLAILKKQLETKQSTTALENETSVADAKTLAVKKLAKEKAVTDAKALAAKKLADAKTLAAKKLAEEKAIADAKVLANKNLTNDKAIADAKTLAAKKLAEEKAAADAKILADKKLVDEKAVADAKILADKKLADEKAVADAKTLADKKLADEKAVADAKTLADKKLAGEKAVADAKTLADKKLADEKAVADAKTLADKKLADEKAVADAKTLADKKLADETATVNTQSLDVESAKKRLAELETQIEVSKEAKKLTDLEWLANAEENNRKLAALEAKKSKKKAHLQKVATLKAQIEANIEAKAQVELDAKKLVKKEKEEIAQLEKIISPSKPQKAKAKPVVVTSPVVSDEEDIFSNPYYLGVAGGGVLFLSLLGWMIVRKRKIQGTTEVESMFTESSEINLPDDDDDDEFGVESLDDNSSFMFDGESSFLSDDNDFDAFEVEQDEVDPISEADVYLAYGRYQQAEELMRQAIEDQPNRDECKFKLLEILAANDDSSGFEKYVQELADTGKNTDEAFWSKVSEMGQGVIPNSPLLTLVGDGVSAAANEVDSVEDTSSVNNEEDDASADLSMFNNEIGESDTEFEETGIEPEANNLDVEVSLFDTDEEDTNNLLEKSQSDANSLNVDMSVFDDDNVSTAEKLDVASDISEPEESFADNDLSMFDDGSLDDLVNTRTETPTQVDDEVAHSDNFEESVAPVVQEKSPAGNEMDFDLSGFDDEPVAAPQEQSPAGNEMDFDLSGFDDEPVAAPQEQSPAGNEMDFDLSGFDDEPVAAPQEQSPAGNEMDFDLSGFDDEPVAAPQEQSPAGNEMDFDLSGFDDEPVAAPQEQSPAGNEMDFDSSGFSDNTDASLDTAEDEDDVFDLSGFDEDDSGTALDATAENEVDDFDMSGFDEDDSNDSLEATAESEVEEFDLSGFDEDDSNDSLEATAENEVEEFDLSGFDEDDSGASLEATAESEVEEFDLSGFGEDDLGTSLEASSETEAFDLSDLSDLDDDLDVNLDSENIAEGFDLSSFDSDIDDLTDASLENGDSNTVDLSHLDNGGDIDLSSFDLEGDSEGDSEGDDFEYLADMNVLETKIDLARAYIDMGDTNAAKAIIEKVLEEGTSDQKAIAQELMGSL